MKKSWLLVVVFVVLVAISGASKALGSSGQKVLENTPGRLWTQGYEIPHIPLKFLPEEQMDRALGLYYYDSEKPLYIAINKTFWDDSYTENVERAAVLIHEYLHFKSKDEGLVEAVALDETALWYNRSLRTFRLWYTAYDAEVTSVRVQSARTCKCPWFSRKAQLVRKQWILTNTRP